MEFGGQVTQPMSLDATCIDEVIARDRAEWVAKIRDLIEMHERGTPQFRHMLWRKTFDIQAYQNLFQSPEEKTWEYSLEATEQSVVDRALSKSYIAILPDDKKAGAQEEIRKILRTSNKVWLNEPEGVFEYPYKAWVVVCHKK